MRERDRATLAREDMKAMLAGKIGANGYREGSVDGSRSKISVDSRSRSRCNCCKKRATHVGLGDGIALMDGCELQVRRWVRDGYSCELCGHAGDWRLTRVNGRYLRVCVTGCPTEADL